MDGDTSQLCYNVSVGRSFIYTLNGSHWLHLYRALAGNGCYLLRFMYVREQLTSIETHFFVAVAAARCSRAWITEEFGCDYILYLNTMRISMYNCKWHSHIEPMFFRRTKKNRRKIRIHDYTLWHHDYHYQLFMQIELFKFKFFFLFFLNKWNL